MINLPERPFAGLCLSQLGAVLFGREATAQAAHICVQVVGAEADLGKQMVQAVGVLEFGRTLEGCVVRLAVVVRQSSGRKKGNVMYENYKIENTKVYSMMTNIFVSYHVS